MSRKYRTYSKMLLNKYQNTIEQPDLKLVETLHKLLDSILEDNLALAIDFVVADLIRCNQLPSGVPNDMYPPELLEQPNDR